jgi:hypothetical protein
MSKPASINHFQDVVRRIRANSWFSDKVLRERLQFKITIDSNVTPSITEVPSEAFESLLLNVRKLTLEKEPQQLHKVLRKLKQDATSDKDRDLLEAWKKYWRLALISEPFLLESNKDQSYREVLTPYRVYDAFINGHYFHSEDQSRRIVSAHGDSDPSRGEVQLFLLNIHHATTCQIAFAALGLDRYIENGCTFDKFPIMGAGIGEPPFVTEFIFCRNRLAEIDDQYRVFSDWIQSHGGGDNCRWK